MDSTAALPALSELSPPGITPDQQKHADLIGQLTTALQEAGQLPQKGRGTLGEKVNDFYAERLKNILKPETRDVFPSTWMPSWDNAPPPVIPTLTLAGVRVGSPGNLTLFLAPPGSGKSSICEAVLASFIIPNVNDIEASNQLILDLLSRAKTFGVSLFVTIHGNPRSKERGEEKARGHLGSELMRKAESVMIVQPSPGRA